MDFLTLSDQTYYHCEVGHLSAQAQKVLWFGQPMAPLLLDAVGIQARCASS
jgi:hypothetical protein